MDTQERSLGCAGVACAAMLSPRGGGGDRYLVRRKGMWSNCFSGRCSALMLVALMVLGTMEPTSASEDDTSWHAAPELAWVEDPSGDFATTTRKVSFGARLRDLEFWRSAFGGKRSGVSADNNVRWGRITGMDLPLGSNGWLIQANFRYVDTDVIDSRGAFAIDHKRKPELRVFSIGLGYRF